MDIPSDYQNQGGKYIILKFFHKLLIDFCFYLSKNDGGVENTSASALSRRARRQEVITQLLVFCPRPCLALKAMYLTV